MMHNGMEVDQATRQAMNLYRRASQRSLWATVRGLFKSDTQRLRQLADFYTAGAVETEHQPGVQSVPISRIQGSVNAGRTYDFDSEFHPLRNHNKDRWLGLAAARQRGVNVPPVGLIKVGDDYFVRDGHHRISVARAMEQTEIRAQVTVWHM